MPGASPTRASPVSERPDAAEDPPHVGVEDGGPETVGEREHGARGVAADSLEGAEGSLVVGEAAAVAGDRLAGDGVEVDRPDVVAEGIPGPLDVGHVGGGE